MPSVKRGFTPRDNATGKLREAYNVLREARRRAGQVPDPRIEALIGELALMDDQPQRAMKHVGA